MNTPCWWMGLSADQNRKVSWTPLVGGWVLVQIKIECFINTPCSWIGLQRQYTWPKKQETSTKKVFNPTFNHRYILPWNFILTPQHIAMKLHSHSTTQQICIYWINHSVGQSIPQCLQKIYSIILLGKVFLKCLHKFVVLDVFGSVVE